MLYDACAEGASVAGAVRGGIAGLVLGLLLLAVVWKRPDRGPRYLALAFLLAWVGGSVWNGYTARRENARVCAALSSGAVKVAEGEVKEFSAFPTDGRGFETFRVGDAFFRIAPGHGSGLTKTSDKGGPIRSGRRVRVTYAGEEVLRVEALSAP